MKKFIAIGLVLMVVALLFGGGDQKEKEFNQQVLTEAWGIIKTIPLPDVGYSGTTGQKLVLSEVKIKIDGYSADTGEPYLVATCVAKDPHPPVFHLVRTNEGEFTLMLPYGSSEFYVGVHTLYSNGQCKFTLAELKEYHGELFWGNAWWN